MCFTRFDGRQNIAAALYMLIAVISGTVRVVIFLTFNKCVGDYKL